MWWEAHRAGSVAFAGAGLYGAGDAFREGGCFMTGPRRFRGRRQRPTLEARPMPKVAGKVHADVDGVFQNGNRTQCTMSWRQQEY